MRTFLLFAIIALFVCKGFATPTDNILQLLTQTSDLVVSGEITCTFGEVDKYGCAQCQMKITKIEVLCGNAKISELKFEHTYYYNSKQYPDPINLLLGHQCIVFLRDVGGADPFTGGPHISDWVSTDPWFSILPYNSILADKIRAIAPTNEVIKAKCLRLKDDLDRAGVDITSRNGHIIVASLRRAELLATLTKLQTENAPGTNNTTNSMQKNIAKIKAVLHDLAEATAIPVLSGSEWIDGRSIVFNNTDLPYDIKNALVQLNYWERIYRSFSSPKDLRGTGAELGKAEATVNAFKKKIEEEGFDLEFDQSLGVWKIKNGVGAVEAKGLSGSEYQEKCKDKF